MVNQSTSSWDAAEMETLRRKWLQGRSAGMIARELNRSRSAIVGKVKRMNLTRNGGPTISLNSQRAPREPKPAPAPEPPPAIELEPFPEPVPFREHESFHCSAVVEVRGEDGLAVYCGRRHTKDSPWCAWHRQLFAMKWIDRRKRGSA